jgi:hypothetical protein
LIARISFGLEYGLAAQGIASQETWHLTDKGYQLPLPLDALASGEKFSPSPTTVGVLFSPLAGQPSSSSTPDEKFTSPIDAEVSANLVALKCGICGICEGSPTPMGASDLDAIINEGTLTIGWVGPALFSVLFAAFAWATGVFQWLGTLATWLFSGAWRGGGRCESGAGGGREGDSANAGG